LCSGGSWAFPPLSDGNCGWVFIVGHGGSGDLAAMMKDLGLQEEDLDDVIFKEEVM
jgi:hypothetical protein